MKDKIQEVHDYFKNKLINGEFIVTSPSKYTIGVRVDDMYDFILWVGNFALPLTVALTNYDISYMNITFSEEDRFKLHKILTPYVLNMQKYELQNEIDKLQGELKDLE